VPTAALGALRGELIRGIVGVPERRTSSGGLGNSDDCPDVAALGRRHGNRRGLITMRWAVGFALLMALVFALTFGYQLGAAYIDQVIAR
jgi:hypothetical protein